jgi:cell wall-associated NlpC family hydrolase
LGPALLPEEPGIYKSILVVIVLLGLGGCGAAFNSRTRSELVHVENNGDSALLQNKAVAKNILLAHFKEWKGTKYVFGGSDRNGIDCSGFIYQTFSSEFGIKLPRASIIQGEVGYDIPAALLQPGDLVFFKLGVNRNYAGIYLDNNDFIHAALSKGVMRSSLNDPYWHDRFWKARRVSR